MEHITKDLLKWYNANKRALPWRSQSKTCNPYHVWLSEIMLQQTTVKAVKPYFEKFIKRWKTVQALADAENDDVMHYWAGLGYYARARNLHKCAKVVAYEMNGQFPTTEKELLTLPGVGAYTAAAICAIAFDTKAVVVDANVQRVISRVFKITEALPTANSIIYQKTASITPTTKSGDFAQAFMDLGSGICSPKNPKCALCPIKPHCKGKDIAETLPRKAPKKTKPIKVCYMYVIQNELGEILAHKRPDSGLLGGMYGLATSDWSEQYPEDHSQAPAFLNWESLETVIRHTFTHFHLDMKIFTGTLRNAPTGYKWVNKDILPTVFKKPVIAVEKAPLYKNIENTQKKGR